jgi:ribose transport system substrate-binding protein
MTRRALLGFTPVLLSVFAALVCCNRTTRKQIAVIPMGRSHVYWVSAHAGAIKAAREENVDIIWNGPATESDFSGQLQIVENMINQHVDAICLAPIDRKALANAVDRASAVGIPVIIWDSPVDSRNFVAQIATDNYAAGQLAAERMGRILNGRGRIVEVACQPGSASTMAREQGFEEKLKQAFPGIQIVDKRYGMAEVAKSMDVAENMLTAFPELDGMFGSNESSTVGAARALTSSHRKLKLVGFDSSPALIQGLKDGVIESLVTQNPFDMGYRSIKATISKLNGGTVERLQKLPAVVVTRDNLNDPTIHARLFPDLDHYLK